MSKQRTITSFFEEGFYFSCVQCGDCCRGFNSGEVYLYERDIRRLVKHLKDEGNQITLTQFCAKYVKLIGTSFYWKEEGAKRGKNYSFKTLGFRFSGKDQHCQFLSEKNKCTVHEERPFQCRAFPIGWNMLVGNIRNVRKYARKCEGLQNSLEKKGEYHSTEELIEWTTREYEIEKKFFLRMKENNFDIFKVYPFLPRSLLKTGFYL